MKKLKKFIHRTICEIIIKGYDNNPHLSELKYLDKDGNEKIEYYKKTIHGDKLLTVSDVNKFHLTNSKI